MVYMFAAVLFAVFMPIGIYHRIQAARSREPIDRRQEGWPLLIGIRLAGLIALGAALTGFRQPPALPPAFQWTGLALLAATVAWMTWMFVSLGRNLTDTVVTRRAAYFVSHGPYRYVRNPMYVGIIAMGLSLGLIQGNWLAPLCFGLCFLLLAIRTRIEERFLLARFGQTYETYIQTVGRFFPRII
ncbi:MAG: methyltransferase family protein [Bryobacteraceae bacterium]